MYCPRKIKSFFSLSTIYFFYSISFGVSSRPLDVPFHSFDFFIFPFPFLSSFGFPNSKVRLSSFWFFFPFFLAVNNILKSNFVFRSPIFQRDSKTLSVCISLVYHICPAVPLFYYKNIIFLLKWKYRTRWISTRFFFVSRPRSNHWILNNKVH